MLCNMHQFIKTIPFWCVSSKIVLFFIFTYFSRNVKFTNLLNSWNIELPRVEVSWVELEEPEA